MNILIVESLYHPDVTAALVDSATAALETGGARFERVAMPSLLEIPATIALAVRSRRYDGYVALGSVTGAHAQTFYTETMRALLTLGTAGTVIGNGIVMATDEGTAHDLAVRHDIGGDAARACLSLAVFAERLGVGSMSNQDARHAARLAAVQALYQMEMNGSGAEEVAQEFAEHRFAELPVLPDAEFFEAILTGVPQHQFEIDRAISGSLSEKWKLERVDSILRAILRCGVYELVARRDVPARVVIDEYVAVAGAFFGADEPGFVNGALDTIARGKRAKEFGLPVPEGELDF